MFDDMDNLIEENSFKKALHKLNSEQLDFEVGKFRHRIDECNSQISLLSSQINELHLRRRKVATFKLMYEKYVAIILELVKQNVAAKQKIKGGE